MWIFWSYTQPSRRLLTSARRRTGIPPKSRNIWHMGWFDPMAISSSQVDHHRPLCIYFESKKNWKYYFLGWVGEPRKISPIHQRCKLPTWKMHLHLQNTQSIKDLFNQFSAKKICQFGLSKGNKHEKWGVWEKLYVFSESFSKRNFLPFFAIFCQFLPIFAKKVSIVPSKPLMLNIYIPDCFLKVWGFKVHCSGDLLSD